MSALSTVLDAFERIGHTPRNTGVGEWEARCPYHDDHTPSLTITDADDKVLLHCHAGCDIHDVMARLNLPMSALFNKPREERAVRQEDMAWYEYADEEGEVLFRVIRSAPSKKFRQERPDGRGGWIEGQGATKDVRRVPYRLPELLKGVANGEPIWVVEGEKDADAIVALGEVATTSPMGVGKWRDEYAEYFRGASLVAVVADADTAGYRHARDVARSLRRVMSDADVVQVCVALEGKDATDHLVHGHDLDEFEVLSDTELDQLCFDAAEMSASVSVILHPGEDAADVIAVASDGYRVTDSGNAQRFIDMANGRVRWVREWQQWIVWQDGVWKLDHGNALVTEIAKRVGKKLLILASGADDNKDALFRAGIRAESMHARNAIVQSARAIPGVVIDHEELDADPYILNCRNGTVDLRTGELRPHDPADLCTMQCPVDYDQHATSSLWTDCLERWQPDIEVREYLRREMGAGATGKPTETLSAHLGNGGNGKSKFFGAIQHVLGPYAVVPHKSLLIKSRHEQHATVTASLFRVRLGVCSETPQDAWLDESQIKNLPEQ